VIVAIVSLVAAVVFNALQVRDSANAERESRLASQLALFTQLDQSIRSANVVFEDPALLAHDGPWFDAHLGAPLSLRLRAALGNMDYIAFMFDHGYIAFPGARERWQGTLNSPGWGASSTTRARPCLCGRIFAPKLIAVIALV
jgi:hypothetical protein